MEISDVSARLGQPTNLTKPAASADKEGDGDSGSSASYNALMSGVVATGLIFARSFSVHPKAEKTERTYSGFTPKVMLFPISLDKAP